MDKSSRLHGDSQTTDFVDYLGKISSNDDATMFLFKARQNLEAVTYASKS